MATPGMLDACKQYMQITYADDDALISALIDAAEGYVCGAGVRCETDPALYNLVIFDMVLRQFDGRGDDAAAPTSKFAAQILQQLKLRSAYDAPPDEEDGA